MTVVPHLDTTIRVSIPPAVIRFHAFNGCVWGLATVNNKDYATIGQQTFSQARKDAFLGRLYKVTKWVTIAEEGTNNPPNE